MGFPIKPNDVERRGIREVTTRDIQAALDQGRRWKLVCSAVRHGDGVRASVEPQQVSSNSPLYLVGGTTSIVQFETDVLGSLSVRETDPGPHTTVVPHDV